MRRSIFLYENSILSISHPKVWLSKRPSVLLTGYLPTDPYNSNERLESLYEKVQLFRDKTFNNQEIPFLLHVCFSVFKIEVLHLYPEVINIPSILFPPIDTIFYCHSTSSRAMLPLTAPDEPTLIVSYVSVISAIKRLKIIYIKRLMNV